MGEQTYGIDPAVATRIARDIAETDELLAVERLRLIRTEHLER